MRSLARCRRSLPFLALLLGTVAVASAAPPPLSDPPALKALKYRNLGPAWGGRVARVSGVVGDPWVYYAATAGGGVWKSADGGFHWASIWDDQPISSIGSIAVAASDPNVIYVGSGEANIRGNVAAGNGIYKSVDAGKSWTHVWTQEGQIGTMIVHPKNPDIAFAAVLGHAFGPNPERGVYRTKDGGKSWQQVLKKDADTGASDVAFDPSNPNILFAGLWQARRYPWDLRSGGPGSGLYVSRDGGDSWKPLTEKGLPKGIWGKVGVAVAPSNGQRVYALIEAQEGGLFRSDDGGETWTRISADHRLRQRPWYYMTLTVSPANPDEVWAPQVPLLKSIDGGKTFDFVEVAHGDNHDLWIDPQNPKRMIGGDDGGVYISGNGGETWLTPALPLGQFYHVSTDSRVPFSVAGAMQDIGTTQGPSDSLGSVIRNTDWHGVGGGEAGWVVSDPSDPDIVYAGEYLGIFTRYDHRVQHARNVTAYPENPSGHGGEDFKYRFQWTAPIAVSPHDPKVIYHGAQVIFRTADGGQTWTAISPDLTRNDKAKEKWAGGPITGDNTGVETYCTVFVIAESPRRKGLIWAGSDDGLVHVTADGGKNWKNVTGSIPGIPEWGTVSMIEPSRWDADTAYLVVDAHRLDNNRPYLWKTTDLGKTWKRLDGGLPADVYLHSVREDPVKKGLLYLASERGVAFSTDDGATWQSLKLNLPTVAVHDLAVQGNTLALATMGRSLWAFDDLSVLRELDSKILAQPFHLFAAPEVIRWSYHSSEPGDRFSGQNPPHGASIYLWLKSDLKEKEEITLDVLDPAGARVARLSSTPRTATGSSENVKEEQETLDNAALPKLAGVGRAVWPLRWDGAAMIQGGILDSGYPAVGPAVVPGTYTLRLKVGDKVEETALQVLPDPRSTVSPADAAEQVRVGLEIRDQISRLTRSVEKIRALKKQLQARNELLKETPRAAELVKGSTDLLAKLDALESRLHNPEAEIVYDVLAKGSKLYSRIAPLLDWAIDGIGAPTQGTREVFAEQKKELDGYVGELDGLVAGDLAALNQKAKELELPGIFVPAAPATP